MAVNSQNNMKHVNTLRGQNAEFLLLNVAMHVLPTRS
jgi:hypothetical protein